MPGHLDSAERDRRQANEELLARLLSELVEATRRGEHVSPESIAGEHPELVAPLCELWAAAEVAEQVALDARDEQAVTREWTEDEVPEAAIRRVPPPVDASQLPVQIGDYELLEELGRGGMGVVYKARQKSLDRVVALKMVLGGQWASAAERARFRAEAEATARLDHPHMVTVYEVGELGGQPYFTMKYVEGTTLADELAAGPMPPRRIAELLAPVCRAVHHAHQHGVLHRDLKPSNVLIDREGRPFVSDFGLAKQLRTGEPLTRSGAILGTPSYMSPEQAAGSRGRLSPASDVYSLGSILYQALSGRPPFQAASPVDTVLQVLETDPMPPRLVHAGVDRDLEMIALRCLQKPPELRYESAAALADDLEAYLAGEPIAARRGGFSQVVTRLFRETHQAQVLENWGLLWMWHSLVLVVLCAVTNAMYLAGVAARWPYLALWIIGLGTWAVVFWMLRVRAGPVTAVERQIAHVWGASIISSSLLFWVEGLMRLPVLSLSPALALMGGSVFLVKAGMLSGTFYIQAAVLYLTAGAMALWPDYGVLLFGVMSGLCFFIPGLKYYRQRLRGG